MLSRAAWMALHSRFGRAAFGNGAGENQHVGVAVPCHPRESALHCREKCWLFLPPLDPLLQLWDPFPRHSQPKPCRMGLHTPWVAPFGYGTPCPSSPKPQLAALRMSPKPQSIPAPPWDSEPVSSPATRLPPCNERLPAFVSPLSERICL